MNRAAALFEKLGDADVDWILSHALERQLLRGDALITAGQPVTAVSVVAKGLLGVFAAGGERLAVVGPGGAVGEMSLLEERLPTESVVALETTSALVLPHAVLEEKLACDAHFAARLFRGMARSLSQRLRRTNGRLAVAMQPPPAAGGDEDAHEAEEGLRAAIAELEACIHRADEAALRNRDAVPPEPAAAVEAALAALFPRLEAAAGEDAAAGEEARERAGLYAQKQLLPYVLLMRTAERLYSKPRGYPGDVQTVDAIQQNAPRGSSRVGPVLDRAFLASPACAALRERRAVLAQVVYRAAALASPGRPARVLALGCGPAGELFDAFAAVDDPALLEATAVDFDPQALAMVGEWRERQKLGERVRMVAVNPVFLALGRAELDGGGYDLVYAPSLTDYADDAMLGRLLDLCHASLRPGGRAVVTALHPRNPCRAFLDHVLEWRLAHRTAEDLARVGAASAFGAPPARAWVGAEAITLFAEWVRDGA